jgi:hypothetical protein
MKLGAARAHAPAAWRLVVIAVAPEGVTFTYHLDRNRLRRARRREGPGSTADVADLAFARACPWLDRGAGTDAWPTPPEAPRLGLSVEGPSRG